MSPEQMGGAGPRSRFRTAAPPLSRDEILDVALRHAQQGDLDGLTVRKLAVELDVTPMALYRHVRDKDDIIAGVADRLLARRGLPDPRLRWDRYLIELATSLRAVLRDHPTIITVFTRQPQVGAAAQSRLAAAQVVLVEAGYAPRDAVRVYAAVHTYTIGFCALEAGRAAGTDETRRPSGEHDLAGVIASFVTEEQYSFGLQAIVRGLPKPARRRSTKRAGASGG